LSNRLFNRFDNRLYRVNGVLVLVLGLVLSRVVAIRWTKVNVSTPLVSEGVPGSGEDPASLPTYGRPGHEASRFPTWIPKWSSVQLVEIAYHFPLS